MYFINKITYRLLIYLQNYGIIIIDILEITYRKGVNVHGANESKASGIQEKVS